MNKTENKNTLLLAGNSLLIFISVYGTFGALVTSFSLTVNMNTLFWLWVTGAVIAAMAAMRYRGKGLIIMACSVMLLFLFLYREIIDGYKLVVRTITTLYGKWIPVTELFSDEKLEFDDPTIFIASAGVVVTILLSFSICLRRSLLNTILVTAPIVFLTFVITDLQADLMYMFCLIAVYLTLLICSSVCPDDYIRRGKLIFPAFASAMAIMLVAYMLTPHGSYSREEHIAALGTRFRTVVARISGLSNMWQSSAGAYGWLGMLHNGTWEFNTSNVDIADAGRRLITDQSLLEITVNGPGIFYIRGYSMLNFNGRSWRISDDTTPMTGADTARAMPAYIAELNAQINEFNPPRLTEMVITRTGDVTPQITYQPYYTAAFLNERGSANIATPPERFFYVQRSVHSLLEEVETFYSYITDELINDFTVDPNQVLHILETIFGENSASIVINQTLLQQYIEQEIEENIFPNNSDSYPVDELAAYNEHISRRGVYTYVDDYTARELRRLALDAGIDPNAERNVIADAVAELIMSSGRYSLAPDLSVPPNEDFALYFINNAEEGYCIHFATAAVLMLRSLDIPARFTSGYVVTVRPGDVGKPIVLTDKNAHAWAEVFYEDLGWLYLEVTPSGGNSAVPSPRPHTPEDTTPATPTPQPTPPPVENTPPPEVLYPDMPDEPSSAPGVGHNEPDVREIPEWLYDLGIAGACVLVLIASLIIRRSVARAHREKNFKQRNANKAAIYIWRYIMRLSKDKAQPVAVEEIALKARFSQHLLTVEERTAMITHAKKMADETYKSQTRFGRFWLMYILALY